ncbi:oxidoreductase [Streptomyces liangshanensis]|uniref:SDR family NAD(P)-dependent oxidoreductase n=1 Tax=Streptomyces liangshanensis TaxID=2717324 RepID=A0A6G9GUD9_9ACTN|nr:oxidoreductase [Streptomyces liangshanensis]QIQ01882.1 SDR family NAD(P)-dependent oxidoreductase [Streptomyces liangshanensis]
MTTQVALITGASSGIGAEVARKLKAKGYTVYGVARRADRLADLDKDGVRTFEMDVTDDASITAGVKRVLAESGRIDVLVNSAGYGLLGSVEETSVDDGRHMFEVNVFGAMRLTQLVVPHMREQRSGRIVNVSSIGGKIYSSLTAYYNGSKHALEVMSDCLRIELGQFGIDVVVVEPGGVRTEWPEIAAAHVEKNSGQGPYAHQARAVAEGLRLSETGSRLYVPAGVVADAIVKAATTRKPKTRYPVGYGAKAIITLRRLLSDRAYDSMALRASRGSRT